MPLLTMTSDYLPYIDNTPSPSALAAANALVQADLASQDQLPLHDSIPTDYSPRFSDLIEGEHSRLASDTPRDAHWGIDLTRYEALDAPVQGDAELWKAALQKAYASAEYLRGREVNLGLLETYGKNAWLVGNSQLEDMLRELEREVEVARKELEAVEADRRTAQQGAAGEMQSLEEAWRTGLGRMMEVQVAAERVKSEILARRRQRVA